MKVLKSWLIFLGAIVAVTGAFTLTSIAFSAQNSTTFAFFGGYLAALIMQKVPRPNILKVED